MYDVIIIGAGAAGLMCAIASGRRGRSVLVLDHANRIGKKILMSGGGRCNFTNLYCGPENFLSANPHFAISALSRYTPWDFVALVERHGVPYHEKTLGQLFCDHSSKDIVDLLSAECDAAGVEIRVRTSVTLESLGPPHRLHTEAGALRCESLVVATGGYSIPTMGATGFAFDLARDLGLPVQPTRAALVPFTLAPAQLDALSDLSGVSLDAVVTAADVAFREHLLFTHRGLSGPAILQASSYWVPGQSVEIDLFPGLALVETLREARRERPKTELRTFLRERLPRRVAQRWCERWLPDKRLGALSESDLLAIADACQPWVVEPAGTEGWRTAEVTLGGVDTHALSSRTLECRDHEGLHFIGEAVDVTGHLGGHNFQWAWASGQAAGAVV